MSRISNPFPVSAYHGPSLFCNRQTETKKLKANIENGVHTTLLSLRRMGKTGLVLHLFYLLNKQKDTHCLYVDIYPTQKQKDLINQLATVILNAFPSKKPLGKKALKFITSLRPVISYDQLTGNPEVTLTLSQPKQQEQSLSSLLKFLDGLNSTVVIALDEFQQISQYPETNTESLLRTHIQPLKNVRFIFSGSSRHVLTQMFTGNKRPFFGSTQMLYLSAIEKQEYFDFIGKQFEGYKRKISNEALEFICEWTRLHTYYTQVLCNRLFAESFTKIDLQTVQEISLQILNEQEVVFFQYRSLLTPAQWQLLQAIAKEDKVYQPTAKDFISRHKLGTPSNVQRSLDALLTKEMVYRDEQKKSVCYVVYDCFLSRWLQRL